MRSAPARLVFTGGDLLAYTREHAGGRLFISLNLGPQPQVPEQLPHRRSGVVRVRTRPGREGQRVGDALGYAATKG